ncbi:beta-propeller fold lactonase family protein [Roseomonas sp. OT10]|uniref:YncE family protein n=1 Tax=Roseomonas cutis TaxID=2897332 RepID=UPI001E4DC80C|nr:YncE family protein [Roseomonas sp. OT10]UFN47852.1 beta-propeller fold lactonase family protein [Roseomonas sp. OT10]
MRLSPCATVRAVLFAAATLLAPAAARADLVFVLNSTDPSIQLLDGRTQQEVRRIPALREVHHLTLTPDGTQILVGDSGGNEMVFLDPATGEVKRRERISNPYHLAFTPDGKRLVVTSLRRDQVDVYGWDGQALTLQGRVRSGDMPSHVAFSPDSKVAYVTLQGDREIAAIALDTREVLWKLEVGRDPAGILWHEGRLLVGIMGSDNLAVVDPEARVVERRIVLGRGTHQVFPSPNGDTIYVTSRVDSRITALDPRTLAIRRVYEVPGGPDDITFGPDGKLWATLRFIRKVGVLDPATGELTQIPVGRSPHGILYQVGAAAVADAQRSAR